MYKMHILSSHRPTAEERRKAGERKGSGQREREQMMIIIITFLHIKNAQHVRVRVRKWQARWNGREGESKLERENALS